MEGKASWLNVFGRFKRGSDYPSPNRGKGEDLSDRLGRVFILAQGNDLDKRQHKGLRTRMQGQEDEREKRRKILYNLLKLKNHWERKAKVRKKPGHLPGWEGGASFGWQTI